MEDLHRYSPNDDTGILLPGNEAPRKRSKLSRKAKDYIFVAIMM